MTSRIIAAVLLCFSLSIVHPAPVRGAVTLKGWFSDKGCAAAKIKADEVTPNGTACVKKCLEDGAQAVFVDPQKREMYDVRNAAVVNDNVGYYLEVVASVDEQAHAIEIQSVKRLGDVVQMCGRKAKK